MKIKFSVKEAVTAVGAIRVRPVPGRFRKQESIDKHILDFRLRVNDNAIIFLKL